MVKLYNTSFERFMRDSGDKRIVCFGAGAVFEKLCGLFARERRILDRIDAVLDNNTALDGSTREIAGRQVPVFSVDNYLKDKDHTGGIVAVVSSGNDYIGKIVEQLDNLPCFEGAPCYIGKSFLYKDQPVVGQGLHSLKYEFKGYEIPKIIHCFWFGNKEMPPPERACVESWRKHCPEYEIKLWNENNYDIAKNRYMKDAYKHEKWGFVPDYARLDIIYEHGGFYLDTDVELLRSLNDFVNYKAVFAFEASNLIAPGLGFASVPRNSIIKEMLAQYDNFEFVKPDGTLNLKTSPEYTTEFFEKRGVHINNGLQVWNDIVILPSDFLCPINNKSSGIHELTRNTYSIHKFSCSWFDGEQLTHWNAAKEKRMNLNDRLLRDWEIADSRR
jgi:hypothetical protein